MRSTKWGNQDTSAYTSATRPSWDLDVADDHKTNQMLHLANQFDRVRMACRVSGIRVTIGADGRCGCEHIGDGTPCTEHTVDV